MTGAGVQYARQKILTLHDEKHVANEILLRDLFGHDIGYVIRRPELFVKYLAELIEEMAAAISVLCDEDDTTLQFVNFTADQLSHDEFCDIWSGCLKRHLCDDRRVVIEITEQVIKDFPKLTRDQLSGGGECNHMIAIDDFGTGYSNFVSLIKFRPNIVKVDMSLLHAAVDGKEARDIFYGLIETFKNADLRVVIDGIENAEQLAIARGSNADFAQGFWFHRPELVKTSMGKLQLVSSPSFHNEKIVSLK